MEYIIFYFDYAGKSKELDEMLEAWKKAADDTEGVTFKGHWIPHTSKWHHAIFYKAESYAKVRESWRSMGTDRDYSKLTHGAMDLFVKRGT
ncbi:MAG: hypothetical protein NWE89_17490 [Candidatus Bathyarchaeota archaeon]|nr:hypothetical protein [Candidatus Bathyarchaeota archaeon]